MHRASLGMLSPSVVSPENLLFNCLHCGRQFAGAQSRFCCAGCERVYAFLSQQGEVCTFEKLRSIPIASDAIALDLRERQSNHSESYTYLDSAWLKSQAGKNVGTAKIQFYVEGIHCAACLWVLEKLPEWIQGVLSARLDLSRSILVVNFDSKIALPSQIAHAIYDLGYLPHWVNGQDYQEHQIQENRNELRRIAVAGFSSGNIMLLAIAVYAGALGSEFQRPFEWISFILFLPVLIYSARPLFSNVWAALRTGSMNIDVPLIVGLSLGVVLSFINLWTGNGNIYFDSIAALIFFLISSRYVLKRLTQKAIADSRWQDRMTPKKVQRVFNSDGETRVEEIAIEEVKTGDVLHVNPHEVIPADGTLLSQKTNVDWSLLTGESEPLEMQNGAYLFAGTVNLTHAIQLKVDRSGSETRLGQLTQKLEETANSKPPLVLLADRSAKWFMIGILVVAAVTVFWPGLAWSEALNRALAVVIVACPCGLALATPLAFFYSMSRAAKEGILIKSPDTLQRLASVNAVAFDKTGTLTLGKPEVISVEWFEHSGFDRSELEGALVALERHSLHPVAQAVVRYFSRSGVRELQQFEGVTETLGRGIKGRWIQRQAELSVEKASISDARGRSSIEVKLNGIVIALITLRDAIRSGTQEALQELRQMGFQTSLLTGDQKSVAEKIGGELGFHENEIISGASPEEKMQWVHTQGKEKKILMVGDGANDALAFRSAFVGLAVQGGIEMSLYAADGYLTKKGIRPIVRAMVFGRDTVQVIYRNFWISIFYNIIATVLSVLGIVTPLWAAIIMPMSSVSVLVSSLIGTRAMRRGSQPI